MITNQTQDLFLDVGEYRPEIYLNTEVRTGFSSFHLSTEADELAQGLLRLEGNIFSRKIQRIIDQDENTLGDHLFII